MKVRPSGSITSRCLKFCRPQKLSSKTSPLPHTYLSGSIGSRAERQWIGTRSSRTSPARRVLHLRVAESASTRPRLRQHGARRETKARSPALWRWRGTWSTPRPEPGQGPRAGNRVSREASCREPRGARDAYVSWMFSLLRFPPRPPTPEGNGPGNLRDADAAPCRRASDAADRPCNVLADHLGREGVIGIDLAAAVGPLQIHPSEAIGEVDPDARNLTHRVENRARIRIAPASL